MHSEEDLEVHYNNNNISVTTLFGTTDHRNYFKSIRLVNIWSQKIKGLPLLTLICIQAAYPECHT